MGEDAYSMETISPRSVKIYIQITKSVYLIFQWGKYCKDIQFSRLLVFFLQNTLKWFYELAQKPIVFRIVSESHFSLQTIFFPVYTYTPFLLSLFFLLSISFLPSLFFIR